MPKKTKTPKKQLASESLLTFITVQPSDKVFASQIITQLTNFEQYGYHKDAHVLIFVPQDRKDQPLDPLWETAKVLFPETKFFIYNDDGYVLDNIRQIGYIPLLRPWTLQQHFKAHPELENHTIFYLDSDVVFTKELDFLERFKEGDTWYFSDAKSYMNATYFDGKVEHVLPGKAEGYKNADILNVLAGICGTDRATCEKNDQNTGGVQYIFKGLNAEFWREVYNKCMIVRPLLARFNMEFFESEDRGIQSWCTDLFVIQMMAWGKGKTVVCPPEMAFAWATDKLPRWEETYLYHDAGGSQVTDEFNVVHQLFNKRAGHYVNNIYSYFETDLSYVSPNYCSYLYTQQINKAKDKINNHT